MSGYMYFPKSLACCEKLSPTKLVKGLCGKAHSEKNGGNHDPRPDNPRPPNPRPHNPGTDGSTPVNAQHAYVEINDPTEWHQIKRDSNGRAIIVYFYGERCGPCIRFAPTFAQKAKENKSKVSFVKIGHIEQWPGDIYQELNLTGSMGMPHVQLHSSDGKHIRGSNPSGGTGQYGNFQAMIDEALTMGGGSGKPNKPSPPGGNSPTPTGGGGNMEGLFGQAILRKKGDVTVATSKLDGCDLVGIYFSAHWCSPCRAFTPKLVTRYEEWKSANKNVEIVFVSADRSKEQFEGYYRGMPWMALPYDLRNTKRTLLKKYSKRGYPTLIFINPKTMTMTDPEEGWGLVCNGPSFDAVVEAARKGAKV